MHKITYEQAALICLYEGITKTVSELEFHYKSHPSKSIKEEILYFLEQQKNCLKIMRKNGLNQYLLKSLSVDAKRLVTKCQLIGNNKVVSSRAASGATTSIIVLLVLSLGFSEPIREELLEKCNSLVDGDFSSLRDSLFEEMEVETFEVTLEPVVGTKRAQGYEVKTLICDKYYSIPCPIELQDYFYVLEDKWGIPARVAMTLVDEESDGQWNTNGVISPTNDYGLPQINKRNHAKIEKVLGYTSDDLLNDPYKSLDAMYYLLTCIFDHYGYTKDDYDLLNVAGAYNGWTSWKKKEQSVEYANECVDIFNTKFTKGSDVKLLVLENN